MDPLNRRKTWPHKQLDSVFLLSDEVYTNTMPYISISISPPPPPQPTQESYSFSDVQCACFKKFRPLNALSPTKLCTCAPVLLHTHAHVHACVRTCAHTHTHTHTHTHIYIYISTQHTHTHTHTRTHTHTHTHTGSELTSIISCTTLDSIQRERLYYSVYTPHCECIY